MNLRMLVAAAIAAGTLFAWMMDGKKPEPTPAPPAPGALDLRGLFVGPTAADDAAAFSSLCLELADKIEVDAMRPEPRIKTGVAIEDLRVAAREARMNGESLGARQPRVRDAVHKFLDEKAGDHGGPLTPESRSAWVAAFREVGRAAADATR